MCLSEDWKKNFAQLRSKADQSGQAVVEYILVLVITVGIILGIMHQFSDAFGSFLDKYFGDYIACLLETGELPSIGGEGASEASCKSPMQEFSIASGEALVKRGSGGGSGSDSGSGSGDSGKSSKEGGSDSSSSSSKQSSRPRTLTSSGGTSNSDGRSAKTSSGRPGRFKQKLNQTPGSQNQSKNVGFNGSGGGIGGPGGRTFRRNTVIYIGDSYLSDKEKKKNEQASLSKTTEKKGGDQNNLRVPLQKLEIKKARNISSEEEGAGFSFAFFIKFLLIGGILIAIFIFLGGQGIQIKKSWQKSE